MITRFQILNLLKDCYTPKMNNIIEYGKFKPTGKQKKKKQIIISHTSRDIDNYLVSLTNRRNGKYDKIPNYVIDREGKILKLLNDNEHTNYFNDKNINRNGIIISLENLGWLAKLPLSGSYVNWIGTKYDGLVVDKKWRENFIWQPYTDIQMKSLGSLCKKIIKDNSIVNNCIGHNTKVIGVNKFEGIVVKSNYDAEYTDVSPAFDFETFSKYLSE